MPQQKQVDLRVQKTERALLEALDTLLKDRPFEAVTVSDLCDAAMVRRATFYKHFGDKYQFLNHCVRRRESLLALAGNQTDCLDPLEGFTAMLRGMLQCLCEPKTAVSAAFLQLLETDIPGIITEQFADVIREKARLLAASGVTLPAPPEVMAAFLSGAVMGVAKWWRLSGAPLTEDEVIESVRPILAGVFAPLNAQPQKTNYGKSTPAEKFSGRG